MEPERGNNSPAYRYISLGDRAIIICMCARRQRTRLNRSQPRLADTALAILYTHHLAITLTPPEHMQQPRV